MPVWVTRTPEGALGEAAAVDCVTVTVCPATVKFPLRELAEVLAVTV